MPAGTGVCVVNTPPARTASTASAKVRPLGDELADALERQEAGVALVGVEHLGLEAERPQHAHAADAEHDLLAQAVLGVAAVQPVGDVGALGAVALDGGVEQVQLHPADLHLPRAHGDGVAGEVDRAPARRCR